MKTKFFKALFISFFACVLLFSTVFVLSFASNDATDAMIDINAAFSDFKISETTVIENDGYIGIETELTTYYDFATHGKAKAGYNGTPYVMYVVNTNTERIGALSDVEIIDSMLKKGYIVSVLDYKNNKKAVSPALDWSAQMIREDVYIGKYLTDASVFEPGEYSTNFIVPAGYDVLENAVFWEIDKHAAEGTLEKIVENWNTDFRSCKKNTLIYWRYNDGTRKPTQNGFDGTPVVWLDENGNEDPNGSYVKVMHTLAKDVTDCTGPDGTPIDLNLYMHVVYPTTCKENPIKPVPIMALASSGGYLSTSGTSTGLRPHHTGSLFRGYAGVVYDYLYQPMEQSDFFGYYDGRLTAGGITNDQMSYSLFVYNDKRVNTAAMRYVRYLTLSNPEKYAFDIESIGVYGNSKGGWISFLGEAELREYTVSDTSDYTKDELETLIDERINSYSSKRQYEGHNDETRYQAGNTSSYTMHEIQIDGGEKQPWLTYTDEYGRAREILSYASWTYASNGSANEGITEGHSPVFSALHLLQEGYNTTNQTTGEISGSLDIPSFYFIVPLGHTLAYGKDWYHGVDVYNAMFDFADYYLKNSAVKVVYTDPASMTGKIDINEKITVKFSGAVTGEQIEKITLTDKAGIAVNGSWSAIRGMTEWTFTPDTLLPDMDYTLRIPSDLCGDNNVEMGNDYSAVFHTANKVTSPIRTLNSEIGTYFIIDSISLDSVSDATLRFKISNDASNSVGIYKVSGFNELYPNESYELDFIDSVSLSGRGYYEVDISQVLLNSNLSDKTVFLMKSEKSSGTFPVFNANLKNTLSGISQKKYVQASLSVAPDGTSAASFYVKVDKRYSYDNSYYSSPTTAFSISNIFGAEDIKLSDFGRKYTVNLRIYDTKSRTVQIYLNGAFTDTNGVHDFNRAYYNFKTTENAWTDITFDYTVYEPIYGAEALTPKSLTFVMESDGCLETPIYIDDISVFETVSNVVTDVKNTSIVLSYDGMPLKKGEADYPFSIENEFYSTLYDALKNAKSGETILAHRNYTIKETDNFSEYETLESICIDLCGYKLYSTDKSGAIISAKATSSSVASAITLKNGAVYLCSAPLIDYNGSTAGGNGKVFNVTLENLYVTNGLYSTLSNVISSADVTNASEISVNVNLNNCNLDIKLKNNSINPITVLNNGRAGVAITYNVKGSEIELDTLVNVKLWQKKSMINLFKNEAGEYLILKLPVSAGETGITASREGDIVSFVLRDTSNYVASFETEINPNATKYGIIPDEYLDAELYPFVLFDKNENFIGAYKIFMSNDNPNVLDAAKFHLNNGWDGSSYGDDPYEAFILMRRDYVLQSEEKYNNLAQTQGTINIDLGGFKLSCGKRTIPMLPGGNKGWNGARGEPIFPSTFIISNGKIEVNNRGAVTMRSNDNLGGGKIADKTMTFIYNNVTFAFDPSNNVSENCNLLTYFSEEAEGTYTASPYYTVYNDCTFDLTANVPSYNVTLFNLNTDGFYIKHSITVNGGKIIASEPLRVTVVNDGANNYGSSIFFGVGSDGRYLTYSVPKGTELKDVIFTAENGNMYFEKTDSSYDADVYTLAKSTSGPIQTVYGTIPTAYTSATEYPFILFCDGSFDNGYTTWVDAITAANSKMNSASKKEVSVIILMRRSYDCTSTDNFANLAQSAGKITVDLGGFTMKAGSKVLFNATAKANDYTTTIEINNGSLLATSNALVYIATGSTAPAIKTFDITFNNVIFGFDGTVGTNTAIIRTPTSSSGSYVCNYNVYFNNCTFDFKNYTQSTKVTLFNLNNTSATDNERVNVFIKSGSILLPSFDSLNIFKTAANDCVTFVSSAENYTSLHLPKNDTEPAGEYTIEGGVAVFVKVYETESSVIYRLRNSAMLDVVFTPKMSITLDTSLIINVYVPVNDSLQGLRFNGVLYTVQDLKELPTITIDDEEYYVFKVVMPSSSAAKDVILKVSISHTVQPIIATFSFSIPKYAQKIIDDASASEVEKTLARDVLLYIREAYEYFTSHNDEPEITRVVKLINSIIGDYSAAPVSSGVTSADESVLAVTLNLDSNPTIRFYISESGVEFFIGDKVLKTVYGTDKNGAYLELDAYAYALCETITYGDSGSYHISSFLTGSYGKPHEALVSAFVKYTESASAYRSYAFSQNS